MSNTLAYSIGKAKRIDTSINKQKAINPGPGAYNQSKHVN